MRDADPVSRCDETSAVWSSADGSRLLTSAGGRLYLWDTRWKLVSGGGLNGDAEEVTAATSPDGRLVPGSTTVPWSSPPPRTSNGPR
ncbi:hypothetical protein [Streptomyces thermolilacinus]|uniref:Uncharacterized protein n=1 Tax=Streptomyces thermolilacinus SPC6 TaxID=1306406 RepID=A0A1D3DLF2_9ACTN|nr:hypothetical protein [Streptomyces thermolilacinus]OEJ93150.1 hypothetical protein J116_000225 [Streptomyces thermolilacinus SPC6]